MKKKSILSVLLMSSLIIGVSTVSYAAEIKNIVQLEDSEKEICSSNSETEYGANANGDKDDNSETENLKKMDDTSILHDNNEIASDQLEETNTEENSNNTLPFDSVQNDDQDSEETLVNAFTTDINGIQYFGADGQPVTGEKMINGYLYQFDEQGYLELGLQEASNGKVYYYIEDEPFLAVESFIMTNEVVRYFDNAGVMLTGCQKIEGDWYYFDETGVMFNGGWREDGTNKYYYNSDGTLVRGFKEIENNTYYFNSVGVMLVGCQKIEGNWYYFDETGAMFNEGWREDGSNKYYYNSDGTLARGEKKIGEYWYFFQGNGNMQIGWRTNGSKKYYYDSEGRLQLGATKIGSYWYYFKNNGQMQTGWRTSGNSKYYYDGSGRLQLGETKIGSYWYYFQNNGKMYTGWRTSGNSKYYYDGTGRLQLGETKIGSYWYYFQNNGKMYMGWRTSGGNKYYYNNSGQLQIGPAKISGKWYYFNSNGALAEDQSMYQKAQQYSSSTKWLILVDTSKNRVGVFTGSKSNWVRKYYWKCTSGASSTPTVKGQFTVGIKGKVFGSGYSCWYYTQFYGNYLFHSILYNPGSMTSVQDGRLGINASHGCVRLSLSNAKWIYDNIPKNTKVVVY